MNENEMMVEVENYDEGNFEEYETSGGIPVVAKVIGVVGLVGGAVAGAAVGIKKAGGVKGLSSKWNEKKAARLEKKLEKCYTKINTSDEPIEVEAKVVED